MKELLSKILMICCESFEVSKEDVLSDCRKTELVYTRISFVKIVKQLYDLPNEKIGEIINRTHNDVHYLNNKKEINKYFKLIFNQIQNKLKDSSISS